jgi:branched-chain amino acid aminotransferase
MTRRTVIELSTELGIACEVRPVSAEEPRNSDEIFITSTAGGVMPVTDLDGRIYGNGKLCTIANDAYWQGHCEGRLSTSIDYDLRIRQTSYP